MSHESGDAELARRSWARWISILVLIAATPFVAPASRAQESLPDGELTPERMEQLVALIKVWGTARTFHPSLGYRLDLDWDAAFAEAVPLVLGSAADADGARAVGAMLAVLDDPASSVVPPEITDEAASDAVAVARTLDDGTLVLRVGDPYRLGEPEVAGVVSRAIETLGEARALVLDLRSPVATEGYARYLISTHLGPLLDRLSDAPIVAPGSRRRVYYGFESDTPFASGQYRTAWLTLAGKARPPAPDALGLPVSFLLNGNSVLPEAAIPLQTAGRAAIVLAGEQGSLGAETETIELPGGWIARVRVTEPISDDGRHAGLVADGVVDPGAPPSWSRIDPPDDPALAAAVQITYAGLRVPAERERVPAAAPFRPDRRYPEMPYPGLGYRVLAAARIYTIIEQFFPYRELLDEDWEVVLRESLPEFVAARDALEYTLAVARMVERLDDSHAYVGSSIYYEHLGRSSPPIRIRMVEGRPVVTTFYDRDAAEAAGVAIGDVVLEVDDEDAGVRLERIAALISASTPQSKYDKAALWLANGPQGSPVRLKLERAAGSAPLEVELERAWSFAYNRERNGEVLRLLEGNIGYADLDRLTPDRVDEMFELFRDTAGIVFDMRGYPLGTAWAIAPRLNERSDVPAALFRTPLVGHPASAPSSQTFVQTIPPAAPGAWTYREPTVLLIDERSQSQAEHTGLFLRAANGTRFVGSPTAGANGEITVIAIPGGISVGFTGQSVEFPDGTRLQRLGLQPDVEMGPTIAGIRAGRDEVLEAALAQLRQR